MAIVSGRDVPVPVLHEHARRLHRAAQLLELACEPDTAREDSAACITGASDAVQAIALELRDVANVRR